MINLELQTPPYIYSNLHKDSEENSVVLKLKLKSDEDITLRRIVSQRLVIDSENMLKFKDIVVKKDEILNIDLELFRTYTREEFEQISKEFGYHNRFKLIYAFFKAGKYSFEIVYTKNSEDHINTQTSYYLDYNFELS